MTLTPESVLAAWHPVAHAVQVLSTNTPVGLYHVGPIKTVTGYGVTLIVPQPAPVTDPAAFNTVEFAGLGPFHLRNDDETAIEGMQPEFKLVGSFEVPNSAGGGLTGAARITPTILEPPSHANEIHALDGPTFGPLANLSVVTFESGLWRPMEEGAVEGMYLFGARVSGASTNARTGFTAALLRRYVPA